jgi:Sap, sulfolipid-1-addressing protein
MGKAPGIVCRGFAMSSILTFLGLAISDAMNPFTVASMAMLLALDRPVARGVIFAVATFAVYSAFAILLAEGFTAAMTALLPLLPVWVPGALLIVLAVLCIGFALYLWLHNAATDGSMELAKALTLPGTAVFAVVSTLSDAPTAVPLFAAVAQLPELADGRFGQYLWLVAYAAIYVSPLLVLLGLRMALGAGADAALNRVMSAVNWSFKHLLPAVLLLAGTFAGWLGVDHLLGVL